MICLTPTYRMVVAETGDVVGRVAAGTHVVGVCAFFEEQVAHARVLVLGRVVQAAVVVLVVVLRVRLQYRKPERADLVRLVLPARRVQRFALDQEPVVRRRGAVFLFARYLVSVDLVLLQMLLNRKFIYGLFDGRVNPSALCLFR